MPRIKTYRKGYVFERMVRLKLSDAGLVVFRCAGSKPIDLIAFHPRGVIYLIECKNKERLGKGEIEEIRRRFDDMCKPITDSLPIKFVLVTKDNYREMLDSMIRGER